MTGFLNLLAMEKLWRHGIIEIEYVLQDEPLDPWILNFFMQQPILQSNLT